MRTRTELSTLSLVLMLVLGLSCLAPAQAPQINASVQYDHSPGTGHKDGIGARGEAVFGFKNRWRFVTSAIYSYEPKGYVGNGTSFRLGGEGRYRLADDIKWKVVPYVSFGAALVNNTTSDYSKTAYFPTIGAGIAISDDQFVVNWRHYIRERRTQNKGASDLLELSTYTPFNSQSKWLVVGNFGLQRSTFTQPNGAFAGKHIAWSYRMSVGVGRKF